MEQQAQSLVLIEEIINEEVDNLFSHNTSHDHEGIDNSLFNILKKLLINKDSFFEFFILDKDSGEIHTSTNINNIGKIKKTEKYFIEGKKSTFIKNIYFSLTLNEPALTISTPIRDENNILLGVLAGRIKLEKTNEIMSEKVGLIDTGETYLVNKFNFLVSKKKNEEIFKDVVYTDATKDCLKHNNGLGLYDNYNDIPVIRVYTWVENRDICLLAEISQKEAFKPIDKLRYFISIIIFIILFLIILLGLLLSRTITRPLLKLIKGSEIISKGNLKYRLNINTKDEIGKLAMSFNKMTKALDKSYEELKSLDRMKDEFISMASHELRTPISTIKGYLSMILEGDFGELDTRGKKNLKIIEESNNRLGKLVDDLLNVSRIKQKRLQIRLEPLNIEKVINDVIDLLILKIKDKGIDLRLDLNKEYDLVLADEDKVKQILVNLIDNAIKYTDSGYIDISIKKENKFIKIIIKDSGIGIKRKDQEKLFTKFYRVKNNKTISTEGTGLGLWITKQLVELMNGTIYLNSKEKKGTEVSFTIPIYKK